MVVNVLHTLTNVYKCIKLKHMHYWCFIYFFSCNAGEGQGKTHPHYCFPCILMI